MSIVNNQFKKAYTKQECDECFQWYERHFDELPPSLSSIRSMRIPDLPRTVSRLLDVLRRRMPAERVFNGEFSLLLLIRQHLIDQAIIKE